MCMKIDSSVQIKFDEKGETYCYKVLEKVREGWCPENREPYKLFSFFFSGPEWIFGQEQIAQKGISDFVGNPNFIYEGLHVFLSLEVAKKALPFFGVDDKRLAIVKCLCKKENLSGVGYWEDITIKYNIEQAVFNKVTPLEEIYSY